MQKWSRDWGGSSVWGGEKVSFFSALYGEYVALRRDRGRDNLEFRVQKGPISRLQYIGLGVAESWDLVF